MFENYWGLKGAYASVNDFMADSINLERIKPELIEKFKESNAKKPIEQNGFDKELLKVNERLNILLMTFYGQMYVIVPVEGSVTNNWVSVIGFGRLIFPFPEIISEGD